MFLHGYEFVKQLDVTSEANTEYSDAEDSDAEDSEDLLEDSNEENAPSSKDSLEEWSIPVVRAHSSRAKACLQARNAHMESSKDPNKEIKEIICREQSVEVTSQEEEVWANDRVRNHEAHLRRTIGIDLIDRHNLPKCLNCTAQAAWTCRRMPQADLNERIELARPRPDFVVAFDSHILVKQFEHTTLDSLVGCIQPENGRNERAFHFFATEAAGRRISFDVAVCRNFNMATQALHNIYMVMRAASVHETFFEKVRVFTVVYSCETVQIRMHRATLPKNTDSYLTFDFDIVLQTTSDYTKAEVLRTLKNIFEYSVTVLLPILEEAVEKCLLERGYDRPLPQGKSSQPFKTIQSR